MIEQGVVVGQATADCSISHHHFHVMVKLYMDFTDVMELFLDGEKCSNAVLTILL